MNQRRAIVFFGAHPDDESFGVGATLAHYAALGVSAYYVCSTGGEAGTVAPEHIKGFASVAELRSKELKCAAEALGLAGLIMLGYRDSGMPGSADNKTPGALAAAGLDEVVGRMVKVIREVKPQVIITHDPSTDYGHPDHIATHQAALQAFHAAGDPAKYPETGPSFQPQKLYFGVRPHGTMKWIVRLMPLFGQDPHHGGRNKDIDMTRMVGTEYPLHAVIRLSKHATESRRTAAACHASQGGGRPRPGPFRLVQIIQRLQGPRDYFTRVYPNSGPKKRENDLFSGVE
jgi:LmbE family N-acetylglucosaminyl deacetylase